MDLLAGAPVPPATAPVAARRRLITELSLEVAPRQLGDAGLLSARLPPGAEIYLPALASVSLADTCAAAAALVARGLRPVAHLAARRIRGRAELEAMLDALEQAGVDGVLALAGDVDQPAGAFRSSLDLLATGLLERHGIRRLAIAGHPEGHPAIAEPDLDHALATKLAFAKAHRMDCVVVTQFVFSAAPALAWARRLEAQGFDVGIRFGVAGPARAATLLTFALQCGVGASARVLSRRPDAARMLTRWTPEPVVEALAASPATRSAGPVRGLHIYPFGGLAAALDWRDAALRSPARATQTGETG